MGNILMNGFTLSGGGASPEQYEVFKDGALVAYFRLRYGEFTVKCPDAAGEIVFEASPVGDGRFDDNERDEFLNKGLGAVAEWLPRQSGTQK